MLFKKKKKKIQEESTESIIPFVIPQITKTPVHIKRKDRKFTMTPAFSAIWGRANIDELVAPPSEPLQYTDRSLDPFRAKEKRKVANDDISEFEAIIIRNEDRQKIFPGSRPITNLNKKDDFEEMNSPIQNESRKSKLEKESKRLEPTKIEREEIKDSYAFDNQPNLDIDSDLLDNKPAYIEDLDKVEVAETKAPAPANEDIDDFIANLEIEDEFKPADIEVEEFREADFEEPKIIEEKVVEKPKSVEQPVKQEKPADKPKPKKNDYSRYKLPPLSIFKTVDTDDSVRYEWIQEQLDIINRTLQEFNIDGNVVNYTKGPSVTRYEVELAAGVGVKKITAIEDNLKMNLAARSLHIEAPIPGKAYVGIEVPNKVVETVNFGNICHSDEFKNSSKLSFGLGVDLNGNTIVTAINKMPHGLIAGTTGSGKSVCSHSLIISLLLKNKPDELKLLLVDPKSVEYVFYEDLPHLVTPIISDPKLASQALKWACDEMDNRYKMFSQLRVRNIEDFNAKIEAEGYSEPKMPYILILIDELADLMQTASADVEQSIQRITQKARAAGMHLIVATQRPTTDVVKGTIKANIPTRIAFRVSSPTDSMTILDYGGAEQLLGRGDMFFKNDFGTTRIQGAFIKDDEINEVCEYIRKQAGPDYIFNHDKLSQSVEEQYRKENTDELFDDVARYVVEMQNASINNLQKRFNIGFNRAQSLIDLLESAGVVSPATPGKARRVLVDQEQLEEILQ